MAPTNVRAVNVASRNVQLEWDAPASAAGFQVFYGTGDRCVFFTLSHSTHARSSENVLSTRHNVKQFSARYNRPPSTKCVLWP